MRQMIKYTARKCLILLLLLFPGRLAAQFEFYTVMDSVVSRSIFQYILRPRLVNSLASDPLELLKVDTPGAIVASAPSAPGLSPSIYIEGAAMNKWQQPVYIVDGVRMMDLSVVATDDIDNIRVLTGAEAIAAYGHDAISGAVVVTTKRAEAKGFHGSYTFRGGPQWPVGVPESHLDAEWPFRPYDPASQLSSAFQQQHQASLRFANRRIRARTSFSYYKGDGPFDGDADKYTRMNLNYSLTGWILPWLRAESTGAYVRMSGRTAPEGLFLPPTDLLEHHPDNPYSGTDRDVDWMQLQLVAKPIRGLEVRAFGSYRGEEWHQKTAIWRPIPLRGDSGRAQLSDEKRQRTVYGLSAHWETVLGSGHALSADGMIRQNRYHGAHDFVIGKWRAVGELPMEKFDNEALWDYYGRTDNPENLYGRGNNRYDEVWQEGRVSAGYHWVNRNESSYREVLVLAGTNLLWGSKGLMDIKPSWSPFFSAKGKWHPRKGPLFVDWSLDWAETGDAPLQNSVETAVRQGYYESYIATEPVSAITAIHSPFFNDQCVQTRGVRRSIGTDLRYLRWWWWPDFGVKYYRNRDVAEVYYPRDVHPYRTVTVRNEGLELSALQSGASRNWQWELSGHYTRLWNRAVSEIDPFWLFTNHTCLEKDKALGQDYMPILAGVNQETGEAVWKGESSTFYPKNYTLGGVMPRASYGIRASVQWRRLRLSVSGYGWGGNRISCLEEWFVDQYRDDIWTEENKDAPYPKELGIYHTDVTYPRARFFRLSQVCLDYEPLSLAFLLGLRGMRVWMSLEDIALWTNHKGLDPEAALLRDNLGDEVGRYPSMARAVFGVSIGF